MLTIENLQYRYAGATQSALADVSLIVNPGEIVGLLGPNGAGKTTLISLLAGILPIQHGHIALDGKALAANRLSNPADIAIAPQDFAFYPSLTVSENLRCFGALSSNQDLDARLARALVFAQLEGFRDQSAQSLSGGLKRRLNLAITTMAQPKYILLDEPTVGVDPQSRAFLLAAVQQLADQGVGIIYTTHYMEEVESLADRVVIIDHGKVLRHGSLAELLGQGQPLLSFRQTGLSQKAVTELLVDCGQLTLPAEQDAAYELQLSSQCAPVTALNLLQQAGAQLSYAEFGRFNLERLFMQLTHRSLRD